MKAKCKKDLFMNTGQQCFTKGKTYEVYELAEEYMKVFDDNKAPHTVWGTTPTIKDGWMDHFTVITEMTK